MEGAGSASPEVQYDKHIPFLTSLLPSGKVSHLCEREGPLIQPATQHSRRSRSRSQNFDFTSGLLLLRRNYRTSTRKTRPKGAHVAVTLRLARHGQKKRPHYRVVAAEKQCWRDGRFLQIVGTYNPMVNPAAVVLQEEAVRKWVGNGAQTTPVVASLIRKSFPGLLEEREQRQRARIQAARKARKERAAKRAAA